MLTSTSANGETTTYTYYGNSDKVGKTKGSQFILSLRNEPRILCFPRRHTSTTMSSGTVNRVFNGDSQLTQVNDPLYTENIGVDAFSQTTSDSQGAENDADQVDALGDESSATDGDGNPTTYTHDSFGNVLTATTPKGTQSWTYNAANQVLISTDTNGHTITNAYDVFGNLTSQATPAGTTYFTYDVDNRLITTTAPNGGVTKRGYDARGNLTSLEDPDHNVTRWTYNLNDQVTSMTDPTGQTITTYVNGLVATVADPDGRVKTYTYDSQKRVTNEVWTDPSGASNDTLNHSYDGVGNLLTASNSAGTYTFTYDADKRVKTQSDPNGITLTFTRDQYGNVIGLTDSQGGSVSSTYDDDNQLLTRTVSGPDGAALGAQLSYDSDGNVTQIQRLLNDAVVSTTTGTYDGAANKLTQTDSYNGGSISYTNAYDGAKRITSETRTDGTGTTTTPYTYDANSEVTSDGTKTYSFDANGNNKAYTPGTDNQVASDGTWNYTYDAAGNVVKKTNPTTGETWFYTFNLNNQMCRTKF